jgi:hypothetical protein
LAFEAASIIRGRARRKVFGYPKMTRDLTMHAAQIVIYVLVIRVVGTGLGPPV